MSGGGFVLSPARLPYKIPYFLHTVPSKANNKHLLKFANSEILFANHYFSLSGMIYRVPLAPCVYSLCYYGNVRAG